MLAAIRNWVVRTMMKAKGETGIVQTMPKKEIVDINTQITAERLMQNGIDPRSLKNADQVENAIIAIENRPKVQQGIRSTKSADVFDLKGKKIKERGSSVGGYRKSDIVEGPLKMRKDMRTGAQKPGKSAIEIDARIKRKFLRESFKDAKMPKEYKKVK